MRVYEVSKMNELEVEAMKGERGLQEEMIELRKRLEANEMRSKTPDAVRS